MKCFQSAVFLFKLSEEMEKNTSKGVYFPGDGFDTILLHFTARLFQTDIRFIVYLKVECTIKHKIKHTKRSNRLFFVFLFFLRACISRIVNVNPFLHAVNLTYLPQITNCRWRISIPKVPPIGLGLC